LTTSNLATLIVGLLFTFLGIAATLFYRGKRTKTYVPLVIGLFIIYITTGPLSHSRERIEAITHLDPKQVVCIFLKPTSNSGYADISLVKYDRSINDSPTLRRISHLLQHAVIAGEGYIKTPTQVGRMEIMLRNQPPLIFGFRKKGVATCISVDSNGETGWHYGLLDAPGLGLVLDSLASASR
jgi:hypothetical protein